ncbi:DUF6152 family protein [Alteraurantiacibacter aquimixticola]|uniref:DUF5666 domain-containing protein n=1 Tax=Alteraurantiacibacter aquimixticola TaxID=2489173 RepID=A0A4T3F5X2_9SPHN|nr:DUF6152 family protein [Alteraurantiacibacter aquimixticola]TIX51889.1 hypothetical protein E5222_05475 [Alteraurantiacibacter aquimixticola]
MTGRGKVAVLAAGMAALALPAMAHHSFAVFFDETRTVSIEGEVTSFRFTNPHGTIALDVTSASGEVEKWRVETTAPVVLQRRRWSRSSLRAGDHVRIDGWPARDGKPYLRLRSATVDGRPVGQAFTVGED